MEINKKNKLLIKDKISTLSDKVVSAPTPGLWVDTEILIGHGYHHNRLGKSILDEVISKNHNTVPISGTQTVLQMLFGVKGPITIPTLYSDGSKNIGEPDDESNTPKFLTPDPAASEGAATQRASIYNTGHLVQLFGVGVTGTAENNITVNPVGYRETKIEMTVTNVDGTFDGVMYPFRYTENELDPQERQKYFGKKIDSTTGKTGYYLKRFEMFPEIKHIWKTGDTMDTSTETAVTDATVFDFTRDDAINTFIECHLQITKDDLKEYFQHKLDQPESCRFNTIALYDGLYTEKNKTTDEEFGDYCNVRLFSKLVIPTEPLSLQKDLEIIYRIYAS